MLGNKVAALRITIGSFDATELIKYGIVHPCQTDITA